MQHGVWTQRTGMLMYQDTGACAVPTASNGVSTPKATPASNKIGKSATVDEHHSDSDSDPAEGWVDAINAEDSPISPNAPLPTAHDVQELFNMRRRLYEMTLGVAGDSPEAASAREALADDDRDGIICRLPLRPQPDSETAEQTDRKGKGKAKPRNSYGLSLEDCLVSNNNTRESTPVPEAGPEVEAPTPTATLTPATRTRVRNTYFDDLVADPRNSAASLQVYEIVESENISMDSSLGLKLLGLARSLRKDGEAKPKKDKVQHGDSSWSGMMKSHDKSLRMLTKVLDKLNDHSEMLNAIAEASGVNLLDDDEEVEAAKALQSSTLSRSAVHISKPVAVSPQADLKSLLDAAQSLPGANAPLPADPLAGILGAQAETRAMSPYLANCPPHPSAMLRPEDQIRPLPDRSPTATHPAASVPTVNPDVRPAVISSIGNDKPADIHASIWSRVEEFAKTSAAARAKAEKEQQDALQAHILDMYRLSREHAISASANAQGRPALEAAVAAVQGETAMKEAVPPVKPAQTSQASQTVDIKPTEPTIMSKPTTVSAQPVKDAAVSPVLAKAAQKVPVDAAAAPKPSTASAASGIPAQPAQAKPPALAAQSGGPSTSAPAPAIRPGFYRSLDTNETFDVSDHAHRENLEYERYLYYMRNGPFADPSFRPDPRFFTNTMSGQRPTTYVQAMAMAQQQQMHSAQQQQQAMHQAMGQISKQVHPAFQQHHMQTLPPQTPTPGAPHMHVQTQFQARPGQVIPPGITAIGHPASGVGSMSIQAQAHQRMMLLQQQGLLRNLTPEQLVQVQIKAGQINPAANPAAGSASISASGVPRPATIPMPGPTLPPPANFSGTSGTKPPAPPQAQQQPQQASRAQATVSPSPPRAPASTNAFASATRADKENELAAAAARPKVDFATGEPLP